MSIALLKVALQFLCERKKSYVNINSIKLDTVEEEVCHEGFKRIYEYFKMHYIFMSSDEPQIKALAL